MTETRARRRPTLFAALLGAAALLTLSGVGVAAAATIEGTGSTTAWTGTPASTTTAEPVIFKNTSGVPHGVDWTGGPNTPSCTAGVPVDSSGTNWNGECSFTQAGSYSFVCTVHPAMMGSVNVSSSGPAAPTVTTSAATSITDTGATLKGSVNPNGLATEYFFKYGTSSTPYASETGKTALSAGTSAVNASTAVTGLTAATIYHFRLFAVNSSGTSEGADLTFTTAGPPTATTDPATGIGGTQATLAGTVNPKGLETKYFFNWGTTVAYGQKTTEKVAGSGIANVSKTEPLTGLAPETTYHFQLVAKNSAGEIKGSDRTFTTLGAPLATTGAAAGVSDTGATLQGLVNAQGQDTTYYFNYGPTAAYGQKTTASGAGKGTSNTPVSAPLTGLSPQTTYHFQLVAQNGAGTALGANQTFTTAPTPPPTPPTPPVLTPTPPLPPAPPADDPPPDTKITSKPPAKTKDRTPTFKFKSTVAGATFKCTLDGKALKPCRSPLTTKALSFGRHTLKVSAVAGGASDRTPAAFSFKVVKP
jgi:plastocyanin